jgi:hypothetical protein
MKEKRKMAASTGCKRRKMPGQMVNQRRPSSQRVKVRGWVQKTIVWV